MLTDRVNCPPTMKVCSGVGCTTQSIKLLVSNLMPLRALIHPIYPTWRQYYNLKAARSAAGTPW